MIKGDPPIIVTQDVDASIDVVWRAITEIDEMHQWYFENLPDFRPEVGFSTEFNIHNEGRDFLHRWTVTKVEAPASITYTWRFGNHEGCSDLTLSLSEDGGRTTVEARCDILESFPDDIPEFTTESCRAGWEYFVQKRLKEYLEKHSQKQ